MLRRIVILLLAMLTLLCAAASCDKKSTEPQQCATPVFNPVGGTYAYLALVEITSTTDDATIRYTIDGTDPTSSSLVYSGYITLLTTTTIKAQAVKSGWTASAIATATYTIQ